MSNLRTIFLWLLAVWVASGPSALLMHHNFAHGGVASGCCAAPTASAIPARQHACCGHHAASCSADRPDSETPSERGADELPPGDGLAGNGSPVDEPSCPSETCPLCELLLHSHAIAFDAPAFAANLPRISPDSEQEVIAPLERPHHVRNPRGPPNG